MEHELLAPAALASGDLAHLERAVALAQQARDRGDHPFGAVLVTAEGAVVEALNSVFSTHDPTAHAESNLVRAAAAQHVDAAAFAGSTLYTSTEPCAMCSGAIYWAGIPRVVFALSEKALRDFVPEASSEPTLVLPSREVFARGGRPIEVVGPVALPAATVVHEGFWA
ncbi:nucleoside deaminase [Herbiconiux sp. 11R-BC]|uniref:nucleoside deaminase n=1 Tax=Herbiconiux sp. 11R-BC TaxID=3111637 RepID=UPI003BFFD6EB